MTIGVKTLVDCVNNNISNTAICQPLQVLQLTSISKDFDNVVVSVANCAALPSAADNKGRMIYLQDTCGYRISDGVSWTNDFTSVPRQIIMTWGNNCDFSTGTLGDGTIIPKSSPVSVIGGFTDWCQISAGPAHNVALRRNGTAWSWGCNGTGRLGDNSIINRSSPVSVVGGFTDWCQVSGSLNHSLGVRTNGTAWAWGFNNTGQLGNNCTVDTSSPVSVVGGFTDWCQVSAGIIHSLGLRQNGTAWGWGSNACAQLGDNSTINRSSPVSVVGGFTDWCQVSAGHSFSSFHSLGLRCNGTLWAWGSGNIGRLGDDSTINRSSPVSVVGGFTDWCQISAGYAHNFGVRQNGTAWGWGCNGAGRLGDNCTVDRSSPVSVVGGFTDWCQVSASTSSHTQGIRQNGTLWAWGNAGQGRLGDNTTISKSSPVLVAGGFTDWVCVYAGSNHGLGLRKIGGF
jgi:alpha-tubulin suppressor-like RCC1 family protein